MYLLIFIWFFNFSPKLLKLIVYQPDKEIPPRQKYTINIILNIPIVNL